MDPADSRSRPSEASLSDPAGRYLFTVPEKPEGDLHTWETLQPHDLPSMDVQVVSMSPDHSEDDTKTDQSQHMYRSEHKASLSESRRKEL